MSKVIKDIHEEPATLSEIAEITKRRNSIISRYTAAIINDYRANDDIDERNEKGLENMPDTKIINEIKEQLMMQYVNVDNTYIKEALEENINLVEKNFLKDVRQKLKTIASYQNRANYLSMEAYVTERRQQTKRKY